MRSVPVFLVGLACLLCVSLAGGKDKESPDLIKANYYYNHLAFTKAIPYYEKIISENENSPVYSRLGDCYRLTGDIVHAADCYKKALDKKFYGNVVMLRYAQVLMQLTEYDEASRWLKEYQKANLKDRRVVNLIAACASAPGRLKDGNKTSAVLLNLNTDRAEFAPTLWNGNLVFTADSAVGAVKKSNAWTGGACYNMYYVTCEGGACGEDWNSLHTGKDIAWHDGPCTFNAAGDTMYFTRSRYNDKFFDRGTVANSDNVVVLETMIATGYDESDHKFSKVVRFPFNNGSYAVVHPTVSPNGSMLVFSTTMAGSGSDLYMCMRNKKGKWLKPQRLGPVVNTEGEEVFPYFANDTTLFFASDGHEGLGGLDVYVAHWDKLKRMFSMPANVGLPVNSPYDDISMALDANAAEGYFSSNRPADKGGDNIYYFKK